MNLNLFFMYSLIIIYSLFSLMRIFFRAKIRNNREIEYREGLPAVEMLNILIIYEVATFIAYLVFSGIDPYGVPFALELPPWLRTAGIGISVYSLLYFRSVHRALGRNFSSYIEITREQNLVTSGPYKRVRHPMYTAFILLHSGAFLISSNLFIGITWFCGLAAVLIVRIPREEKKLMEKFGQEYEEYMKRTGRLFPMPRKRPPI